jgi:ribosomal protein S19
MARSIKKGPFIDESLVKKIEKSSLRPGPADPRYHQILWDIQLLSIMVSSLYLFI